MSTSANVIEYEIRKDGKFVGHHRQNLLCEGHYEDLLQFEPLEEYTIFPYGYNEDEEIWEGREQNLKKFLIDHTKFDKKLKIVLENKNII